MIFDTHAHYDDEAFDADRDEVLAGLKEKGVSNVVNVSAELTGVKASLELAQRYDFIYASVGIHPSETMTLKEEDYEYLKKACADEKVVAVGEIGLDYHYDDDRNIQKYWFERQIELAKETKLPLIIHSRDAAADTLSIIKGCDAAECGGVIHCFSYGVEMAREYLNMGFYLGIGGVLTFKNGKKLKETVEYAPMESLVLETDCPYLAPEPFRGKRNDSSYIAYVVKALAQIKGLSEEEVIDITEKNARKMYGIG